MEHNQPLEELEPLEPIEELEELENLEPQQEQEVAVEKNTGAKKRFFQTHPYLTLVLLFLASFGILEGVYLVTSSQLFCVIPADSTAWGLFALNWLPVFLLLLLLYFISGRGIFTVCLGGFVFFCLSIISRVKVSMRQEPLLPTDFSMAKEVYTIVKTFPMMQFLLAVVCVLLFIVVLAILLRLPKSLGSKKLRIAGVISTILLATLCNSVYYKNTTLYDGFPMEDNPYFLVNQYRTKGLLYSFVHQFNIRQIVVPAGYQKQVFEGLEDTAISVAEGEKPHIIMIMGEAFSDLSENPHLDFTDYRDPMQVFKEMAASEHAISGKIVVPNFGGGTSNTEYDVLTACSTRYLDNALPSYNFINSTFDALPHRLSMIGYDTLGIHPGYAWFYNRQNIYPYLGLETNYFLEDSFDLSKQGIAGYVSDKATFDKIIDTLDTHIAQEESPLFSFTVTIQNHGPYDSHYGTLPKLFDTDITLSAEARDLLSQYFKGVTDTDIQLARLREYAENSDEPIVIVYFGDHLPGFSNGMEFFPLLDYPISPNGSLEERLGLYETPYLIWENDAANALCNIEQAERVAQLPDSGIISANYLGALLVEVTGMDGLSPLYDTMNALRREVPVAAKNIYVDAEGVYSELPPEGQPDIAQWLQSWQYYKLFDEEFSTN